MNSPRPVPHKDATELKHNDRSGNERSQNGKHREAVRCRLERMIVAEELGRQPDLHGGQDNSDVQRCAGQPSEVIVEEGAVPIPASHVPAHRRPGDGVDLAQTTQTQLPVDEAAVDVGADVFCVQLLDKHPPPAPRYL